MGSRYIPKHDNITVSQEFTIIELAIGLGLASVVYKMAKERLNDAKKTTQEIRKIAADNNADFDTSLERYNKLIAKMESARFITEQTRIQPLYTGGAKNGMELFKHNSTHFAMPLGKLINRTEGHIKKLIEMNLLYDEDKVTDGDIELEEARMGKTVKGCIGKELVVNGLRIVPHDHGVDAYDYSDEHQDDDILIAAPTPEEAGKLLILCGEILNLQAKVRLYTTKKGYDGYSGILWWSTMDDILDYTLYSLTGYLLHSIEK